MDGTVREGIIVETEAYIGPEDRASHAFGNRKTPRTEPMFLPGGHTYVYLCYGLHWLTNIVTGPEGYPAAVLIRSIIPLYPIPRLLEERNLPRKISRANLQKLGQGPGRVSATLRITGDLNREDLTISSHIWIEDRGMQVLPEWIQALPRVGVEYAREYASLPLRFVVEPSPFVSHLPRKKKEKKVHTRMPSTPATESPYPVSVKTGGPLRKKESARKCST